MDEVMGMSERRAVLATARAALTGIGSVLWEEPGVELGPLLREIDDVGRLVDAARMAVVDEAMTRGEMRSYAGPNPMGGEPIDVVAAGLVGVGWVREWAPTMKAGGAGGLVRSPNGSGLTKAASCGRRCWAAVSGSATPPCVCGRWTA